MPWDQASLIVRSATRMLPGTWRTSSGRATPASRAAAIVTSLLTEPGSNGDVTDGLLSCAPGAPGEAGLNDPELAIESTWPVCASRTTALPLRAPTRAVYSRRRCSTAYCRSVSRVRTMSRPACAGCSARVVPGMTASLPSAVSTTRKPSWPARVVSSALSSPIDPRIFWRSMFQAALPTTVAATSPAGYCRDSRSSSAISGNASRTWRAAPGSTSGASTT